MTQDFFMGQLRLIAIGIIAYLAGSGHLSASDASAATAILTPIGLLAAPYLWSLYVNVGKKLVPSDSIAVPSHAVDTPDQAKAKAGDIVTIGGQATRVVGAILIALCLSCFALVEAKAASLDPLAALKNFAIEDIQTALDDATANNDTAGAQCWSALLPIVQSQQALTLKKMGVFTALQKARDAVRSVDMLRAGLGPIGDLKNKCAAVIVDTNTFLLRLGVVGGGAVLGF